MSTFVGKTEMGDTEEDLVKYHHLEAFPYFTQHLVVILSICQLIIMAIVL